MDYQKDTEPMELTVSDILKILKRNKFLIFLILFIVLVITAFYAFFSPKIYEASAVLKISAEGNSSLLRLASSVPSFILPGGTVQSDYQTSIEIIKSRRTIERVMEELKIQDMDRFKDLSKDQIIKFLSENIEVQPIKDTSLVKISFQDKDKEFAKKLVDTLVNSYIQTLKEVAQNEASNTRKFIESQLPQVEERLNKAELALQRFKEKNKVFSLDEQAKLLLENLSNFESQFLQAKISVDEAKNEREAIQKVLSKEEKMVVASQMIADNPVVVQLRSKLVDLNIELAGLLTEYKNTDQQVLALKKQIDEVKKQLQNEVSRIVSQEQKTINPNYQTLLSRLISLEVQINTNDAYIQALEKVIKNYQSQVDKFPEIERELFGLMRERQVAETLYTMFVQKKEEARIQEAGASSGVSIVDGAFVSDIPVKPNKKLILAIGFVLGIFLGVLGAFGKEFLDKTIKDSKEVFYLAGDTQIIGQISKTDSPNLDLVTLVQPYSITSENFRLVAGSILFSLPDEKSSRVIAITSSVTQEGKTFIAANLAVSLANSGMRIAIMNLDMRKPRIEELFGVKVVEGLSDYILSKVKIDDIIQRDILGVKNLDLLPIGSIPPNPISVLNSNKIPELINVLKERYDLVIVDTPPILPVADTSRMSNFLDGTILVVRLNQTPKDGFVESLNILRRSKHNVLGIIINGVHEEIREYYYNYYYGKSKRGLLRIGKNHSLKKRKKVRT